jgi:uncharacterized repeat protein (TIGR01451 family)
MPGTILGKSMYVIRNHHTGQFDAWNINPDGSITYQATYNLTYAGDPAGVAVWVDPSSDPPEGALFISSEFDPGVELVDAKTMTSLGSAPGAWNLAGIDIDDANRVVYAVERLTNHLYVYDWDPVAKTLTLKGGYPKNLPNCIGAAGIALDDIDGLLYVADAWSSVVRVYDITTLTEVSSFAPSIPPVGIALDRKRGFVYTTAPDGWCAWIPSGYTLLSKYDLSTGIETTVDMGHGGMGIAVDEVTGYIYVTGGCYGDDISIWDSSLNFVYSTGPIGNPAGIAIGNVGYNPLNLAKNDAVVGYGIYIGQTFTYEITCENTDSLFDKTGVTIVDDLPMELDFVSESVDGVSGTGIYDSPSHTVTWYIGTIPAGLAGPLVELTVKVNQNAIPGSTIYNYCTIMSDQGDTSTVIGEDPDDTSQVPSPGTYINPSIPVAFDIKPQSCPNPLNVKNPRTDVRSEDKGSENSFAASDTRPDDPALRAAVLPVAILGAADFNVTDIDVTTVTLEGVTPLRYSYEDVAAPVDDTTNCACTTRGPDGYKDLTLKFDRSEIIAALGEVADGEVVQLTITGNLGDGTPIVGTDCVIILGGRQEVDGAPEDGETPDVALIGNYPNPFNPVTEISFNLPNAMYVQLEIYNIMGQKVATVVDGFLEAGQHTVQWDASSFSSGVYFYRLTAGDLIETKKMMLLK